MLNELIAFKDTVINKFGPVLGYALLIAGALLLLSILGFLLKTAFAVAITLLIGGAVVYGILKLIELFKPKH